MQTIIENRSIEDLWKKSISECKQKVLENVILNGEFNIEEIDSNFIKLKKKKLLCGKTRKNLMN